MHTLALTLDLAGAAIRSRMQYRANFLMMVAFGLVYQTTGFVFIWTVLTRFETIAGWTLGEITFLYGLRLVVHGLNTVLFGGVSRVRWQVREGLFDRYLVRPVPPLLQVAAMELPAASFGDLLGGATLFLAANALVGIDYSPVALGYLALAISGGVLIEAALQLIIATLSFRLIETGSLAFFVDELFSNFGNYPLKIFGGAAQAILTWVLPVAFVAYLPSTVLLARTDELVVHPAVAYGAPVVGALWFAAAYLFWRRELREYKSAGH
ncbi:MAG TPA: ABC-2 family transporter protein [Chloroflexota bacterium]|nr:ABC-2 family transporter protein [Chloroflexota bacterium]